MLGSQKPRLVATYGGPLRRDTSSHLSPAPRLFLKARDLCRGAVCRVPVLRGLCGSPSSVTPGFSAKVFKRAACRPAQAALPVDLAVRDSDGGFFVYSRVDPFPDGCPSVDRPAHPILAEVPIEIDCTMARDRCRMTGQDCVRAADGISQTSGRSARFDVAPPPERSTVPEAVPFQKLCLPKLCLSLPQNCVT
jgi:hypothetical protein